MLSASSSSMASKKSSLSVATTLCVHHAVSSGSVNVVDVAKLLLLADADPNSTNAKGHRPFDVIDVSPKLPDLKATFEELLKMMILFISRISRFPLLSNIHVFYFFIRYIYI